MTKYVISILFVLLTTCDAHGLTLPAIIVDSVQLSPSMASQTASIDVSIGFDGAVPFDLIGFQLTLSVSGPDQFVQFVSVGAPVSHPYLFAPTSTMPSSLVAGDGLSVELGDFLDTGFAPLDDGVGFASLMLEVQPGALGNYVVDISIEPTESFLAQSLTEFVDFDVQDGQISVVPEPDTLLLTLLALVVGCRLRGRSTIAERPNE